MKILLRALLTLAMALAFAFPLPAQEPASYTRTEDVIYGRKFGSALTLDVFQPEKPNGHGVIWVVSGGFFSSKEAISKGGIGVFARPFLNRGYTVFAVVHGSQPRYIVPEIMQDLHRASRFIHANAARWGVDPDRLGVTGGSAGGHLSLVLGTQGGPGRADAKDPVDRASSAVAAVACFYPPTDFANWSGPGDDAVGFGTSIKFKPAFGPRADTAEGRAALNREIAPLLFLTAKSAPALILHGDSDKLVPLQQAKSYEARCREVGATCRVVVKEGADHGWKDMHRDAEVFADWFDEHLRGKKK
jgi:acetyl esterase/lipase